MSGEGVLARRWYDTAALCARYGVSRYTIRNWERDGRLPSADRSRGRPRWWGPLVESWDAEHEPAVSVGAAGGGALPRGGGQPVGKVSGGVARLGAV